VLEYHTIPDPTGNAIFTETDALFLKDILCPLFVVENVGILYVFDTVEPVKYINKSVFITVDKVRGNVEVSIDK
jgi:hypothetical protein